MLNPSSRIPYIQEVIVVNDKMNEVVSDGRRNTFALMFRRSVTVQVARYLPEGSQKSRLQRSWRLDAIITFVSTSKRSNIQVSGANMASAAMPPAGDHSTSLY